MSQLLGPIIAGTLTILVLSYLIGDNPLYRLTLHIFIGILVGYAVGIVVREILVGMALPSLMSNPAVGLVPFLLGILLLVKGFPRQASVGNASLAYLIGVGAAVALGGALLGTLGPQIEATGQALSPATRSGFRFGLLDSLMVMVGTVCTLSTFAFAQLKREAEGFPWPKIVSGAASIGRVFLVVAFGLAFAGAITASLSIFVSRLQYIIDLGLRAMGL